MDESCLSEARIWTLINLEFNERWMGSELSECNGSKPVLKSHLHFNPICYQLLWSIKSSGSCQAVVRQSLGSRQTVVRQSSGSCQAVVRKLSCSCQAIVSLHKEICLNLLKSVYLNLPAFMIRIMLKSLKNSLVNLTRILTRKRRSKPNFQSGRNFVQIQKGSEFNVKFKIPGFSNCLGPGIFCKNSSRDFLIPG